MSSESRWRDESWLAMAREWVDERLAGLGTPRTGDADQVHVAPWSTVLKVPTAGGPVWFKANAESQQHEEAIVALLAERRPDAVPPLLAVDKDAGFMLLADAGEMLRTVLPREQSLDRWRDALRLYAGVQLDTEDAVDALLAAGAPDRRLAGLPEQYVALMDQIDAEPRFRAAADRVAELAEELAAYGITETLQHDDLHDGQVFVKDGRNLLMDWGDACVSHPFFTLSVTLEGVIAWGLDDEPDSEPLEPYLEAYLAPYRERYADRDLDAAARTAMRLGWACRAVNGHLPGDEASTLTRLRMWVDGRP